MSDYGNLARKITLLETDKRFADLKIRLFHDNISQAKFFREIITGYIEKNEDILAFVDSVKEKRGYQSVGKIKKTKKMVTAGRKSSYDFRLNQEEIEDLFDIIEMEEEL